MTLRLLLAAAPLHAAGRARRPPPPPHTHTEPCAPRSAQVLVYPIEMMVARHVFHQLTFGNKPWTDRKHFAISLGLWCGTVLIGSTVDDLGIVLELVGGGAATVVGFMMPAALYFRCRPRCCRWRFSA